MTSSPSLWPKTCITVTAPYVTADQYNEPTTTPAAAMGQNLLISLSTNSTDWSNGPRGGKTIMYSALHCGQETLAVELPPCFSSIQRWRQTWWTHFAVPRQRQGLTHWDIGSSSSVAKHTQQRLQKSSKSGHIAWCRGVNLEKAALLSGLRAPDLKSGDPKFKSHSEPGLPLNASCQQNSLAESEVITGEILAGDCSEWKEKKNYSEVNRLLVFWYRNILLNWKNLHRIISNYLKFWV